MAPGKVSLHPYYKGDAWTGFAAGPVLVNDIAPEGAIDTIKLQFRTKTGELGFELNNTPEDCKGNIVVLDAANWLFEVGIGDVLPLDKGIWYWDLEVVDTFGKPLTILAGKLKVKADITHT